MCVCVCWNCVCITALCLHLGSIYPAAGASLVAQTEKNLPAMWKTGVWSLGQDYPLEKEMANHSPQGCKESDTTEWLPLSPFHPHCWEQHLHFSRYPLGSLISSMTSSQEDHLLLTSKEFTTHLILIAHSIVTVVWLFNSVNGCWWIWVGSPKVE